MFELDNYESKLHKEPPAAPTQAYEPAANVKEMSLLFWGEHCVECAAPSCYRSCDLYQARPDKRCRRFLYGSFKNRNFASLRGYGVEVSFKKWAKIETFGNLALYPVDSILAHENRRIEWAERWGSRNYIEKLAQRLHRKSYQGRLPEVFMLEVYNPTAETVRLQLNFNLTRNGVAGDDLLQLGPSFVTTISFPSGYSRHEVEATRLHGVITSGKPFKISMIPEADNNARLVFLTADFVNFVKTPITATQTRKIKCVVWDLDNTLWNGILIEGDNVVVRPEIRLLLKQLDERGVLLSIASKNEHASALQKLHQLGLSDYFLYPQINWAPKTMNIKAIADRLNIGVDTLAFVDDNPFELDQVAHALPEVVCIDAEHIALLFTDDRFQGSTNADARQRRRFYQEAIARETAGLEFGPDYLGFVATCKIALEIAPHTPEDSERVAELVQRTNHFNFSGRRYSRSQLDEFLANPRLEKYVLRSSDKYGSYGTIGFSIVEPGVGIIRIRDFMLSCRVQGKFLEQAFFHHLVEHHNPDPTTVLWVNFHRTERNKPAQQLLEVLGFHKCDPASDGLLEGMVHSSPRSQRCDFIQVQCSACRPKPAKRTHNMG